MQRERLIGRAALAAMVAILLAAVALALPPAIDANGQGVTVYLGYLPEVSNWGPYEATGQAYVNAGEGRAHITVDHMIHDPAIRYEVWLVRADDRNTLYSVGTFEVDGTGHADVELFNPDLKPAEFRFLVITAEPASGDDPRLGARRTVAGVFPNAMARSPTGGAVGFEGIWTQPVESAPGSSTSGSVYGGASPATAGSGTGEMTSRQSSGTRVPPPRLPVTGGSRQAVILAIALVAAGVAIARILAAGGRVRRVAVGSRRIPPRGDAR